MAAWEDEFRTKITTKLKTCIIALLVSKDKGSSHVRLVMVFMKQDKQRFDDNDNHYFVGVEATQSVTRQVHF